MIRRRRIHSSIPLSPMADMAFLLLVFMLATTQFKKDEGLKVLLPSPHPSPNVRTFLLRSNKVYFKVLDLDTVIMIHRSEVLLVPTSEIRNMIRRKIRKDPDIVVSIRTSANAPYSAMINVLDEIKTANPRMISVGMLQES